VAVGDALPIRWRLHAAGFGMQLPRPAQQRQQSRAVQQRTNALPLEALDALAAQQPLFELSEGLETPVQLIYLLTLLGFLVVGAYLVVRQVNLRHTWCMNQRRGCLHVLSKDLAGNCMDTCRSIASLWHPRCAPRSTADNASCVAGAGAHSEGSRGVSKGAG